MVDTNDEWIMTRIGVKERHILNEEGLGTSYMARKAAKQLMQRTGSDPDDIDLVIVATTTPDYHFPSTASILCDKLGLKHAFAFDLQAACSGFLFLLETGANFIRSGRYKKIILLLWQWHKAISFAFREYWIRFPERLYHYMQLGYL